MSLNGILATTNIQFVNNVFLFWQQLAAPSSIFFCGADNSSHLVVNLLVPWLMVFLCFEFFWGFLVLANQPTVHNDGVRRGRVCGCGCWRDMWHATGGRWQLRKNKWHVSCDTWYVTHDTWHVTCDMGHGTNDTILVQKNPKKPKSAKMYQKRAKKTQKCERKKVPKRHKKMLKVLKRNQTCKNSTIKSWFYWISVTIRIGQDFQWLFNFFSFGEAL